MVIPRSAGPTDIRDQSTIVLPEDLPSESEAAVPESQEEAAEQDESMDVEAPPIALPDSGPTSLTELAAGPVDVPDALTVPLTINPAVLQTIAPEKYRGVPPLTRETFNSEWTLPPLNALPAEYHRKPKGKTKAKKGKEKQGFKQDDWTPAGLTNFVAPIKANPVAKRVARATKVLSTRDWNVRCHRSTYTKAILIS